MKSTLAIAFLLLESLAGCNPKQASKDPRTVLIERISRNGDVNDNGTPTPLVTLEEFFDGNDDPGSIGYNFAPPQPRPTEFYALFESIRARPNVADVRVAITQHDDPNAWPVTDTIWIITSASNEEVTRWLGKRFVPDDLLDGFPRGRKFEPVAIPPNMRAVGVWWD